MDTEEANKFINSLVKNLQVLCHGHVSFDSSIQVIGHLYLNVDSQTNIDYIVNEKVCKGDDSSTMFVSKSYHSEPQKKEKKNPEKNQNRDRHHSAQSETNVGDHNQRNDRLGFSSNYDDMHHHKTSHQGHAQRRPSHHMEGPTHKLPRMSHSQSPNMSPSSRNSPHPGFRLDNRNVMGDNSNHHTDLSRLQQSNISETSFHLPQHAAPSNSQRRSSTSSDNSSKPTVKQEPIHIDLSRVKAEPDDDGGGTEEFGGDMSNDEFLASLQDKNTSIYPVGIHSNESQSSASSSQQFDFNLPISFQQGAGAGPSGSMAPDGPSVGMIDIQSCIKSAFATTKKRTFISTEQKRELCLFSEENPCASSKDIVNFFHEKFGLRLAYDTLSKILKTKERWLANRN